MSEPKEFKKTVLDPVSPSFCAAKWLGGTIWLSSGQTASCFHPPSHKIPLDGLDTNPSLLHNTPQKKQARKMMLEGRRPSECEYCWNLEDNGELGDRPILSMDYDVESIRALTDLSWDADVTPESLEIAFDRNCNLACAYCNSGFSSTWGLDIKKHGPYTDLSASASAAYKHTGLGSDIRDHSEPYVDAFFRWWPELSKSLRHLRITGGEPLMSPHFWKFVKQLEGSGSLHLGVNTNLQTSRPKIDALVEACKSVKLKVFTSNETVGDHAEYIRDGLIYDTWKENVEYLFENGIPVHVMMSVNGLCLERTDQLIKQIITWRRGGAKVQLSTNIVLYPRFQHPCVLPIDFRRPAKKRLETLLEDCGGELSRNERVHVERVAACLEHVPPIPEGHTLEMLQRDFTIFYRQYDERRGKSMRAVFPDIHSWSNGVAL